MAERFRIRLPWTASRASRGSTSQVATATSGNPAPLASPEPENSNSNLATGTAQRPPFRPAGIAPVPSSPSRSAPQSRPTTPSSSPNRKPSSPSKKLEDQSRLPSEPTETPFPVPDKESQEPPKTEPQPVELQPKKETTSDTITEPKLQQPEITLQPSEESEKTTPPATDITEGQETPEPEPEPSQKSDIITNNQEPKPSVDSNHNQESKHSVDSNLEEAKEVIQETGEKDHNEAKLDVKDIQTTKEQPTIAFQPEKEPIVTDSHKKLGMSKQKLPSMHNDIKDNSLSKLVQMADIGENKQSMEERLVNVITLAGDNRGASMQFGFDSSKKELPVQIHRAYKSNPDEIVEATTEESSGERKCEDEKTMRNQEVKACVNCNIQGSNNSILLNSSVTERNPGVNLEIQPIIPTESGKSCGRNGPVETHKAEFNTTRAQKLTYEPTIRRRCLGGLFQESSDSDLDNPKKPRRHGCRVYNKDKDIENEA